MARCPPGGGGALGPEVDGEARLALSNPTHKYTKFPKRRPINIATRKFSNHKYAMVLKSQKDLQ